MKKIIVGVIILVVAVAAVIIFSGKKEQSVQSILQTAEVKRGEINIELSELGEIQSFREIDIKSRISGRIVKFYVNEGEYVEQGALIAEIEPDFNQANQIANIRNSLHLAQIRLNNAKKEAERKQLLYDQNYISKDELDKALDEYETANVNFLSAGQQFELVREIDTDGNISRINATASGTVIKKMVEEGEMVISSTSSYTDGTVIIKLADLKQMMVNSHINEIDIAKIHINQKAKIQVDAYPYESYSGYISKIGAMAILRNNVKVFPIEIKINEQDTLLKPGMTANVTIFGESKQDILKIPIKAIFSNQRGEDIVYKVVQDSIGVGTLIKTGINDYQYVEIIEGVDEGELVSLVEP